MEAEVQYSEGWVGGARVLQVVEERVLEKGMACPFYIYAMGFAKYDEGMLDMRWGCCM